MPEEKMTEQEIKDAYNALCENFPKKASTGEFNIFEKYAVLKQHHIPLNIFQTY